MTTLLVSDSPEVTYCRHCDLFFGTLVEGNGVVRCPRCRQPNDSTAPGVIQLDYCTFQCLQCNLRFGAVVTPGQPVVCPLCVTHNESIAPPPNPP